jgi:hypothetical protein
METMANNAQALWIWQQFGNKQSGSNMWIGWCDLGDRFDCPRSVWGDKYTWAAPENPNIIYHLVGEQVGSNGGEANCGYSVFNNKSNDGLRRLYYPDPGDAPAGSVASFISPRQTETVEKGSPYRGNGANTIPNNIGILGWRLGTARCDHGGPPPP